jgi:hypothetical protein
MRMKNKKTIRFDCIDQEELAAVWGFRGQGGCYVKEYLATVYSLDEDAEIEVPGANYEFKLFMLHPSIRLNLRKSVWKQHTLKPIIPAAAGFQFVADSHEAALEEAGKVVNAVIAFEQVRTLATPATENVMQRIFGALMLPPFWDTGSLIGTVALTDSE